MKLRWWRKCSNAEGIKEAEQALESAKKAGEDVENNKRPRAEQVAAERAQHVRENNFSRLFEEAMHLRRGSR